MEKRRRDTDVEATPPRAPDKPVKPSDDVLGALLRGICRDFKKEQA